MALGWWISLAVCSVPALAPVMAAPAQPTAKAQAAGLKRFSLSVKNERPKSAFALIGERSGELVLVDSSVKGAVTADWKNVTAEEAIVDACRQLKATWKRIYLPPGTVATGDNVSQIYRALRALQASGLVAFEPDGRKGTMLLLNTELPKDYRTVLEQPNSAFRAGYLILDEKTPLIPEEVEDDEKPWQPGEKLTPKKMARLEAELLKELSQMSPEERQAALQLTTQSQFEILAQNPQLLSQMVKESAGIQFKIMADNPELMQSVMQTAVQAQIDSLMQMSPEQRQGMLKAQVQAVQQIPKEQLQQLMELMGAGQRK